MEVKIDGAWGTVCDDFFDLATDGTVACQQLLGSVNAVATELRDDFGPGSGAILMDDVRCTGDESSLTSCVYVGSDNENCNHGEDVGLVCTGLYMYA